MPHTSDSNPACDCAGAPCGGAAAPPPPHQGVGEQCPQGTMLAGRANPADCGRGGAGRHSGTEQASVRSAPRLAAPCPWFPMRPQSQVRDHKTTAGRPPPPRLGAARPFECPTRRTMTLPPDFDYEHFAGFAEPAYTQVPDVILDHMMADLNEAELKVLLYIVRRTLGFKKQDDAISLDQLVHGIHRGDGQTLDRGTGLSRSTVRRGITGLLARHLIVAHQNMDPYKGQLPTTYALRWAGTTPPTRPLGGYPQADRGGIHKRTGGVSTSEQGGGS